ncbi:MAG: WD40 repeat domain-containing protein [Spirosomataceae bacterium]
MIRPKLHVEKLETYTGHRDAVYTVIPGPDLGSFISGSGDGQVVLWQTKHPDLGKLVAKMAHSVYALWLDLERNRLWIGHNFEGIVIIDLHEWKVWKTIPLGSVSIYAIQGNSCHVLIGDGHGRAIQCDAASGEVLSVWQVSQQRIRSLVLHPTSDYVWIGSSDHHIRGYNLVDSSLNSDWLAHEGTVFDLAFDSKEKVLYSVSRDAKIKSWQVSHHPELLQSIPAHMYGIHTASISSDGRWLATGSMDKSIKIWDLPSCQLVKVIDKGRFMAHGTSVNAISWLPGTWEFISASDDRTLSHWSIQLLSS